MNTGSSDIRDAEIDFLIDHFLKKLKAFTVTSASESVANYASAVKDLAEAKRYLNLLSKVE
jgi:hypothetical protein